MSSAPRNERHCMPRSTAPWTTQKRDEEWTLGRISSSIEPAVKIVLLEEAQRRFEAEDTWWRENRDAKALFIEEFLGLACKSRVPLQVVANAARRVRIPPSASRNPRVRPTPLKLDQTQSPGQGAGGPRAETLPVDQSQPTRVVFTATSS